MFFYEERRNVSCLREEVRKPTDQFEIVLRDGRDEIIVRRRTGIAFVAVFDAFVREIFLFHRVRFASTRRFRSADDVFRFDQIASLRFRQPNGRADQPERKSRTERTERTTLASLRELIQRHGHVEHLLDSMRKFFEMLENLLVFGHENSAELSRLVSRRAVIRRIRVSKPKRNVEMRNDERGETRTSSRWSSKWTWRKTPSKLRVEIRPAPRGAFETFLCTTLGGEDNSSAVEMYSR